MICGNFTVSRPANGSVLELLPPVLHLKPAADGDWLEAILRRMVSESAIERPGQGVALSRLTEVLFVEVLRSWINSLGPGQGGWRLPIRHVRSCRLLGANRTRFAQFEFSRS
jgi:hypothetical protein